MSLDWLIAVTVSSAPDIMKYREQRHEAILNMEYYNQLMAEFCIPHELEMKIRTAVADPAYKDKVWSTIEDFLRKNPRYFVAAHHMGWGLVGVDRLDCHRIPGKRYSEIEETILRNNIETTVGMLALVCGGYSSFMAHRFIMSILNHQECNNRYTGTLAGYHDKERTLFPDIQ